MPRDVRGVVLGADSTQTINFGPDRQAHYFNHAQKLFEIGEESTLGVVTWGLGSFDEISYRRMFADLGDHVKQNPQLSVREVVQVFVDRFWTAYSSSASWLAPFRVKRPRSPSCKRPRPISGRAWIIYSGTSKWASASPATASLTEPPLRSFPFSHLSEMCHRICIKCRSAMPISGEFQALSYECCMVSTLRLRNVYNRAHFGRVHRMTLGPSWNRPCCDLRQAVFPFEKRSTTSTRQFP